MSPFKNKIKYFLFLFFLFLLASSPLASFAQEKTGDADNSTSTLNSTIIVANVSIYNAKIISQQENNFNISFELANGSGSQSDIKYSVRVSQVRDFKQFMVDENIYNETVSINENSFIEKNINYQAPNFLSGKYQLWIVSSNSGGLMLGGAFLGDIDLIGKVENVQILPESCYIIVAGEKSGQHYTLGQGVDILPTENLIASCKVVNNSKKIITLVPQFQTYRRNLYGEKVSENLSETKIILKPAELKTISIDLPKEKTPQAYDIKLNLSDSENSISSNPIVFHYVLGGGSATIQNVIIDKDQYKKGDIAHISLFFGDSADNFPDSRYDERFYKKIEDDKLTAGIGLTDGDNKSCSDSIKDETLNSKVIEKIDIPIIRDCLNPKLSVSIKGSNGNVLDKKELSFVSTVEEISPSFFGQIPLLYYLILTVIAVFVLKIFWVLIKKGKGSSLKILIFSLFISGIFLSSVNNVYAATWSSASVCGSSSTSGANGWINIDKSIYLQGETMTITHSEGNYWVCSNNSVGTPTISVSFDDLPSSTQLTSGLSIATKDTIVVPPLDKGDHYLLVTWGWSTAKGCSYSGTVKVDFYVNVSCTSVIYSDYGDCQENGTRLRSIISRSPSGCYVSDTNLSQSCVYKYNQPPTDPVITCPFFTNSVCPSTLEFGKALSFHAVSSDPDHDKIAFYYQWYKNKVRVDQNFIPSYFSSPASKYFTLNANNVSKSGSAYSQTVGDDWSLKILAQDSHNKASNWSIREFTIVAPANIPPSVPKITCPDFPGRVCPATLELGKSLKFSFVATDPDGDQIRYLQKIGQVGESGDDVSSSYANQGTPIEYVYDSKVFSLKVGDEEYMNVTAQDNSSYKNLSMIPAQVFFTIVAPANNPPNPPTVDGPKSGFYDTSYKIDISGTDPDKDQVYYGIDYNKDGVIDERFPSTGLVPSGTKKTREIKFIDDKGEAPKTKSLWQKIKNIFLPESSSYNKVSGLLSIETAEAQTIPAGTNSFNVYTVDSNGAMSTPTTYTIGLSDPYLDIGLRMSVGTPSNPKIAKILVQDPNNSTSPFKITKNGVTYGIVIDQSSYPGLKIQK